MASHPVALQVMPGSGDPTDALARLREALGDTGAGPPDDTGIAEVEVDDFEGALQRVWDAMAAAGADDHLAFAEHPDLPEHWRRRAAP